MHKDFYDSSDALETHRQRIRVLALRLTEANFDVLRGEAYSFNLVAEPMLQQVGAMLASCPDKDHAIHLLRFVGEGLLRRAADMKIAGLH